jgi:hypothetical protein
MKKLQSQLNRGDIILLNTGRKAKVETVSPRLMIRTHIGKNEYGEPVPMPSPPDRLWDIVEERACQW